MLSVLKRAVRRISKNEPREIPIYVFCHHKVGTRLLRRVFSKAAADFGWTFSVSAGYRHSAPRESDVVVFNHSLVDVEAIDHPFVGVHMIRDPRDIIISGYLYHMRCREPWCINTRIDTTPPIRFPIVPRSQEHKPEQWKQDYLTSLDGLSYQDKLKSLKQEEGIFFEMEHYAGWTLEEMLRWNYNRPDIMEVTFEQTMNNFRGTFESIFRHLLIPEEKMEKALAIASKEDLNAMSERQIAKNTHIASRDTSKWMKYFTDEHREAFKSRFGDALVRLGYETSNDW